MKRRPFALGLALTLAATPALAQNFTQDFTLTGAGSTTANGYYVGPYQGSVPGLPTLDVYCVDFLNSVSVGDSWTANFTSVASLLSDPNNLLRTRWGQYYFLDAVPRYQQAAWLATQFALNSTGSWGGIHGAIWDIFTPTDGNPNWDERLPWMDAAASADLSGFNWDYWYVVTDVTTSDVTGGKQEYLTYITPEPEVLLLMGTGLAAVFGVALISRRQV